MDFEVFIPIRVEHFIFLLQVEKNFNNFFPLLFYIPQQPRRSKVGIDNMALEPWLLSKVLKAHDDSADSLEAAVKFRSFAHGMDDCSLALCLLLLLKIKWDVNGHSRGGIFHRRNLSSRPFCFCFVLCAFVDLNVTFLFKKNNLKVYSGTF